MLVVNNSAKAKEMSDVVMANRPGAEPIEVKEKFYTRDIFKRE